MAMLDVTRSTGRQTATRRLSYPRRSSGATTGARLPNTTSGSLTASLHPSGSAADQRDFPAPGHVQGGVAAELGGSSSYIPGLPSGVKVHSTYSPEVLGELGEKNARLG